MLIYFETQIVSIGIATRNSEHMGVRWVKNLSARLLASMLVICLATFSVVGTVFAEEDTDGDGLADWWELQYFGDLNQEAGEDFDGDSFSNLEEFEAETDPTNPNDKPRPPTNYLE
jgi:hypothetical protein